MCKDSPNNGSVRRQYLPEDGPHGPKRVVSEWKEIIIKNFVAIDGHYNKVLVTNATGCTPPKIKNTSRQ
jgi:hypothetical protein